MAVTKEVYSRYGKIAFQNGTDDDGNVKIATNSYALALDATDEVVYPIIAGLGAFKEAAFEGVRLTENATLVEA